MPLRAVDPNARFELRLPEGDDDPTVFTVRPMTKREVYAMDASQSTDALDRLEEIVSAGLVGWDNFLDDDGREIAFNEEDPEANYVILSLDTALAVGQKIRGVSGVPVGEVKNSE